MQSVLARSPQPKRWLFRENKILRRAVITAIVALSLLPAINIVYILATTGDNTPSSDDAFFMKQFLNQTMNGAYDWRNFPRDTFSNAHCKILPGLVYIGLAYFTDFNVYAALYLGVLLAAIKLFLMHDCFTRLTNSKYTLAWWLMWPLLAALVFSVSQISTFEHDLQTILNGSNKLGAVLGIWGLARFRGRWAGALIMAAGGVIASVSFGNGPVMWPVFLIGMALLGFRKPAHYLLWAAAAAVSVLPYTLFLKMGRSPGVPSQMLSLFNYSFVLDMLGRPMVNNVGTNLFEYPAARRAALLGLALCLIGLILLWRKRRTLAPAQAAPALMAMAYGLFSVWQTSIFREAIAPWYVAIAIPFWIGLVALAYVLWVNRAEQPANATARNKFARRLAPAWSLICVVAVITLYATSNITYADKSFFLRTRAPVSATCVRNYRNAPTYCENTLVPWHPGNIDYLKILAEQIEPRRLSVFAPQQRWTLQGDFILDSVRINEAPEVPDIIWSADLTNLPVAFRDYKHLNLFLHTPNSVSWTVTLPENLTRAEFHSAIAISESTPDDPEADGVTFEVYIEAAGKPAEPAFFQTLTPKQRQWHPFSIPLSDYAGQTITLRLASSMGSNNAMDWAMYRYPYIDVAIDETGADAGPVDSLMPMNTDLSPVFIKPIVNEYRFDITDKSLWQTRGLRAVSTEGEKIDTWLVTDDKPLLRFNQPINVRLADYSHFSVRMSVSANAFPRAMRIYYAIDGQQGFDDEHSVIITLLSGAELHEYTYDLKLLELSQNARLTGIMIGPLYGTANAGKSQVTITDFRLIRFGGY